MSIMILRGPEAAMPLVRGPQPLPRAVIRQLVQCAADAGRTVALRACSSEQELLDALRVAGQARMEIALIDPGSCVDSVRLHRVLASLRYPYVETHDDSALPAGGSWRMHRHGAWLLRAELSAGAGNRVGTSRLHGDSGRCPRRYLSRVSCITSPTTKAIAMVGRCCGGNSPTAWRYLPRVSWMPPDWCAHCAVARPRRMGWRLGRSGCARLRGCSGLHGIPM